MTDPEIARLYGAEVADADELFQRAVETDDPDELRRLWVAANALVGRRSPLLDGGAFFVYGYLEGRRYQRSLDR